MDLHKDDGSVGLVPRKFLLADVREGHSVHLGLALVVTQQHVDDSALYPRKTVMQDAQQHCIGLVLAAPPYGSSM